MTQENQEVDPGPVFEVGLRNRKAPSRVAHRYIKPDVFPAGLALRGSQSRKDERKLKIPEISHMRAMLEVKRTPIHTETPKQMAMRMKLMV